jgi:hypothetical protein
VRAARPVRLLIIRWAFLQEQASLQNVTAEPLRGLKPFGFEMRHERTRHFDQVRREASRLPIRRVVGHALPLHVGQVVVHRLTVIEQSHLDRAVRRRPSRSEVRPVDVGRPVGFDQEFDEVPGVQRHRFQARVHHVAVAVALGCLERVRHGRELDELEAHMARGRLKFLFGPAHSEGI